jgi:hypothetical protein
LSNPLARTGEFKEMLMEPHIIERAFERPLPSPKVLIDNPKKPVFGAKYEWENN